jgi:hypothetical protein
MRKTRPSGLIHLGDCSLVATSHQQIFDMVQQRSEVVTPLLLVMGSIHDL